MERRPMVIELIDDRVAELLRRKTPAQRLEACFEMWRFARDRLNFILRDQHPDWNEEQLRAEFRRRMLGSE